MVEELNELPRPRLLVVVEDDELRLELEHLRGWSGSIDIRDGIRAIDWSEHDAVITDYAPVRSFGPGRPAIRWIADSVPIFYLASPSGGQLTIDHGLSHEERRSGTLSMQASPGRRIAIDESTLDPAVSALARSSLSPSLAMRASQWGLKIRESFSEPPTLTVTPILSGPGGLALAGMYDRGDGIKNWFLPTDTDLLPWIRLAVEEWGRQHPETFPSAPDWQHAPPWLSDAEQAASARIASAETALAEARQAHARVVAEAEAALHAAQQTADAGARRLLTASGDDLQDAVEDALLSLSLEVRPMDDAVAGTARHEDLQVRWGDRLAIVEVTGTKRGVAQAKWVKVTTHLANYLRQPEADTNVVPWLVVNQHLESEPSTRPPLWNPDFHAAINESGGVAIESAALFVLADAVSRGVVTQARACELLFDSVGVLSLGDVRAFLDPIENDR